MASELGPCVDWHGALVPARTALEGRYVTVRALRPAQDAAPLFGATHGAPVDPDLWTYLGVGPFADEGRFARWLWQQAGALDPVVYTIVPRAQGPLGLASLMRIDAGAGTIEIGWIVFAPALQRTRAATEALYLMAAYAFEELGYRRLEWKCNALNARSRRAAERLGFTFEGVFRQARVDRGRNRDSAWYAIIDGEWPRLKAAFEAWLEPRNFADQGRQCRSLAAWRDPNTVA